MPELILPAKNGEAEEVLPDLPAECCAHCKWYKPLENAKNMGQCRRNPPIALVVGMMKDALGRAQPLIDGAFPAVRPEIWCGEFSCAKPH